MKDIRKKMIDDYPYLAIKFLPTHYVVNLKKNTRISNSFEQLYLKGQDWFTRYDSENDFVVLSQLVSKEQWATPYQELRDNYFVCFNRRIRPHRYALIAMLYHNNLLKNNLVSFSLERGKDLNHLGQKRMVYLSPLKPVAIDLIESLLTV